MSGAGRVADPVDPRPAATVVLLRAGRDGRLETLLARRPSTMVFAADMHVFPGGRVDAADADPRLARRSVISPETAAADLGGDLEPGAALAAFVAAIRESFEEAGVLFADVPATADLDEARSRLLRDPGAFPGIAEALDLRLRTDLLVPLSRWVTPPGLSRRFDTRFFAAMLPDGAEPTLVGEEVVTQAWRAPSVALEAMAAGALSMWLPTSTTLQQLEHVESIEQIRRCLAPGRRGEVVVEPAAPKVLRIEMPAGGGVAGQPVNAYLVGERAFVLVDPGDPTGQGLDRAVAEAARLGGTIRAIALTHPDPDHAGGAESLREQLDVPVFVGAGGGRQLPYATVALDDGSIVDAGDVPLRVVGTPGPRDDHVAFIVGAGDVVLSGDLEGTRGARSVLAPVDGPARQASTDRLRGLAPRAAWLGGHTLGS